MNVFNLVLHYFFILSFLFYMCASETLEEWNLRIEKKIDLIRKDNSEIILDANIYGQNVKLQVTQTTSSFPLGTAVKASMLATCLDDGVDDSYCTFVKDNFNFLVIENAMKWYDWEPSFDDFQTEYPDKAITWAQENEKRVRGHCLFWAVNDTYHFPNWVAPLRGDEMKEAIDHRILTAVSHYEVNTIENF